MKNNYDEIQIKRLYENLIDFNRCTKNIINQTVDNYPQISFLFMTVQTMLKTFPDKNNLSIIIAANIETLHFLNAHNNGKYKAELKHLITTRETLTEAGIL